jgi:3-oxoacyl-[acyl-carrier protein] reductase
MESRERNHGKEGSTVPLRRSGEPEEVAPTAVFLASDAATHYVGQTLGPTAGM